MNNAPTPIVAKDSKPIPNIFLEPPMKGSFEITWTLSPLCDVDSPSEPPLEHVVFSAYRKAQYDCCQRKECGYDGHNIAVTTILMMPIGMASKIRPTQRSLFALFQHMLSVIHDISERVKAGEELATEENAVFSAYSNVMMSLLGEYEFDYIARVTETIEFDEVELESVP